MDDSQELLQKVNSLLVEIKKANHEFAESIGALEYDIAEKFKQVSKELQSAEKNLKRLESDVIDEIDSAIIDLVRPSHS